MSLGERDSAQLEVHVPDRETGTDCRWTSLRSGIVNCAREGRALQNPELRARPASQGNLWGLPDPRV